MSKYNRHGAVISKQSDNADSGDYWFKKFQDNLQKDAVKSRKEDSNLFDQINTIMNGKSKFKSVDAAVEDMKNRSGFSAHFDNLNKKSEQSSKNKIAQLAQQVIQNGEESTPLVFENNDEIKQTAQNIVEDSSGTLPDVTVKEKLKSIFNNNVSDPSLWDDPNLLEYISKLNAQYKKPEHNESHNLGKRDLMNDSDIDPANSDPFLGLMPTR